MLTAMLSVPVLSTIALGAAALQRSPGERGPDAFDRHVRRARVLRSLPSVAAVVLGLGLALGFAAQANAEEKRERKPTVCREYRKVDIGSKTQDGKVAPAVLCTDTKTPRLLLRWSEVKLWSEDGDTVVTYAIGWTTTGE